MNNAQALFREGVEALREQKNIAEGRRLLIESLRQNPENDMAWVWLARTTKSPDKKQAFIERALSINPANPHALALQEKLAPAAAVMATAIEPRPQTASTTATTPLSPQQEKRIALLLKKAEHFMRADDPEAAIEQWVEILSIQVDHEEAMRSAVGQLARLKYMDDARELIWRAIDAGTTHPSIYLTAIDIARRQGEYAEADELRERLARLPDVDAGIIEKVVQHFVDDEQLSRAHDLIRDLLKIHPENLIFLKTMGDIYRAMENEAEALRYYDRAARLGAGTKIGREADKTMVQFTPVLTDTERGSLVLAWREAIGFGIFFLFLAWQDAGLDLMQLGSMRWMGIALSIAGGYLLVTATSSPQQQPLARWLGGQVPDHAPSSNGHGLVEEPSQLPIIPPVMRFVLGTIGGILLVVAAWLVFSTALHLLNNPVPPTDIPSIRDLLYGSWG